MFFASSVLKWDENLCMQTAHNMSLATGRPEVQSAAKSLLSYISRLRVSIINIDDSAKFFFSEDSEKSLLMESKLWCK